MVGLESRNELSSGPLAAAAASGRIRSLPVRLPDVPGETCLSLVGLEVGKRTLPAPCQPRRVREAGLSQKDPQKGGFRPGCTPTSSCGLEPLWLLAPPSCIFPVPLLGPTINENQEGEWGLERVIPSLFIGLHRGPGQGVWSLL